MTPITDSQIGRFGHHPDPAIDFCIEVEEIEGLTYNATIGLDDPRAVGERISRAMSFRVGGDEGAVQAKATLRACEAKVAASIHQPSQPGASP